MTNTIHKRKRKMFLDITNKCQHVIKDECQTDQQGWNLCVDSFKQFCLRVLVFLVP